MVYLTILNSLILVYLIISYKSKYHLSFDKESTFTNNNLLGYRISVWEKTENCWSSRKFSVYIPIRNRKKTELHEEVSRMIAKYSKQQKLQSLSSKFSFLKTLDEVKQFETDYSVVDKKIVEKLVSNFIPKNN